MTDELSTMRIRHMLILRNTSACLCVAAGLFLFYALYQVYHQDPAITPKSQYFGHTSKPDASVDETKKLAKEKILFKSNIMSKTSSNGQQNLSEEVTIVTMYINIGDFQKGEPKGYIYTPNLYKRWMKSFSAIKNPVVAFFDKADDLMYFEAMRLRNDLGLTRTKVFLIVRDQLWAFRLKDRISKIFHRPGYPKWHPNTVIPDYSCAMHAKYEFMSIASEANFFSTKYLAWLDVGLFRSLAISPSIPPPFHISLPPKFNISTVAYSKVNVRNNKLKPAGIINDNLVWVCGCFFIGEVTVLGAWTKQYMRATEALLNNYDLMSTDQQVLYILFNHGHPKVAMQVYSSDINEYDAWFYLGYLCKEAGNPDNNDPLKKGSKYKYLNNIKPAIDYGN